MKISNNSLLGATSGKIGNLVYYSMNGKQYARSMPTKKKRIPSPLQLANYAKFALAAHHLSVIKDILKLGFGQKTGNKVIGYNAAMRAFLAETIIGEYPNLAVDYPKMKLSKGSWSAAQVNVSYGTNLNFSWHDSINKVNACPDDKMMFIIYNETKHSYALNDRYRREDLAFTMPYPGSAADVLHIWLFCVKYDGRAVSNSRYVGAVEVPA